MKRLCRAATQDGTPCKRPVKREGGRCQDHRGEPGLAVGQRGTRSAPKGTSTRRRNNRSNTLTTSRSAVGPAPRRAGGSTGPRRYETLTKAQRRRVEAAASFCADVIVDGWEETVADQAAAYVTDETWHRVFRGRRRRRCRLLAEVAATILEGKKKLHDLVGTAAGWLVSMFGMGSVEQQLARELASRLPLPPDGKLVAAARGVQVTGVLVCVVNGNDLVRCQCFIDLALDEAKTRVKQILSAAAGDWCELAHFRPTSGPLGAADS